jgi:hypothetical protein
LPHVIHLDHKLEEKEDKKIEGIWTPIYKPEK